MKVTLDIEDNNAPFLIELLEQLSYVSIVRDENFEVPEWHKKIVLERINDPNAKYVPAEEVFSKLKKKLM